jgi:hypothetical protein
MYIMPSNKKKPLSKVLEKIKIMYCNNEHASSLLQQAVNSLQT